MFCGGWVSRVLLYIEIPSMVVNQDTLCISELEEWWGFKNRPIILLCQYLSN
jgi:hypothetical protein